MMCCSLRGSVGGHGEEGRLGMRPSKRERLEEKSGSSCAWCNDVHGPLSKVEIQQQREPN